MYFFVSCRGACRIVSTLTASGCMEKLNVITLPYTCGPIGHRLVGEVIIVLYQTALHCMYHIALR